MMSILFVFLESVLISLKCDPLYKMTAGREYRELGATIMIVGHLSGYVRDILDLRYRINQKRTRKKGINSVSMSHPFVWTRKPNFLFLGYFVLIANYFPI